MKLIKYFIRTFGLIFLVAVVGLAVNLNRLAQITEYHEEIQEEWSELDSLVSFQNDLNDLISYISFHQIVQTPSQSVLKNKIQRAKERLNAIEVCALDATSHHVSHEEEEDAEGHAAQEEELLNKLKVNYNNFVLSSSRQLIPGQKIQMPEMIGELKNLLSVQTNAFALQLVYVEGMQKALSVAESVRKEITNQAILFSTVIVLALAIVSIANIFYLRKRTNEALVQQNLLTIGALTKNLIHEIRNPLGIIKSSASVLRREGTTNENSEELIGYMIEEIDRIDSTFKHLLRLQDNENIPFSEENISDILKKVIVLFEGEAKKHKITMELVDEAEEIRLLCNEDLLRQVFINVLLNAIQASREGGRIIVRTFSDPSFLNISVEDFGVGIEQKELKRIFDVFYTTKSKGMGIGLLIVKSIIDRHKGKIDIQSQVGQGTTLTIRLPYANT